MRWSAPSERTTTPSASMFVTMWPVIGVTPRLSSALAARRDRPGGNEASTRSPVSISSTRAADGSVVRKSRRVSWAISAIWPGHLDTGRPGADHDERQQRGALDRVGLRLGRLERAQDLRPRICSAPSSDFSSAAWRCHSGWPK